MRHLKITLIAVICLYLSGCASAPPAKPVKIKPDPSWMQDYPIPLRNGETMGAYKDWSFELWQTLQQVNVDQAAEREFYDAQ